MDDNYELDYKAMFDQLFERLNARLDIENEYFRLIKYLQANSPVINAVTSNMVNLPMNDQLLVLRAFKGMGDVCIRLQEKHKFEFDIKEEQ
jgi:hypothetical protein